MDSRWVPTQAINPASTRTTETEDFDAVMRIARLEIVLKLTAPAVMALEVRMEIGSAAKLIGQ